VPLFGSSAPKNEEGGAAEGKGHRAMFTHRIWVDCRLKQTSKSSITILCIITKCPES